MTYAQRQFQAFGGGQQDVKKPGHLRKHWGSYLLAGVILAGVIAVASFFYMLEKGTGVFAPDYAFTVKVTNMGQVEVSLDDITGDGRKLHGKAVVTIPAGSETQIPDQQKDYDAAKKFETDLTDMIGRVLARDEKLRIESVTVRRTDIYETRIRYSPDPRDTASPMQRGEFQVEVKLADSSF